MDENKVLNFDQECEVVIAVESWTQMVENGILLT